MTVRLYYQDPTQVSFVADVVERLTWEGKPAVVLDRSAFYPTGGGQPCDVGWLDGVPVVDVVERESDGAVLHILAQPLATDQVQGQVDWERRFDLMQQHTGQHILSEAFVERLDAHTVGFHLSDEYATIDLDRAPLSAEDLQGVEELANRIVFENRPVEARFVSDEEVGSLPLRKPLTHQGPVRVVQIAEFDCSACGGTHVRATGQVGMIKITRSERRGEETRVEFLCGNRALQDYALKNTLVMDLARQFTVSYRELGDAVQRLVEDLKESRKELHDARDALLDAEAAELWHQAPLVDGVRVVHAHFPERSPDDLKHLAQRLVSRQNTVALLGGGGAAGQKGHFTFARSQDVDLSMGTLVRQACQMVGGRGGGRPEFAQGGGPDVGPNGERVGQALDEALQAVLDLIPARRPS
jgi:alanyl-tRNA synthetase